MRIEELGEAEPELSASRLALKPPGSAAGFVDGAWWPRSRNLTVELPSLIAALAVRLGRAGRVTYNLTTWRPSPRRLVVDGQEARLEGFRSQHADTLTVISPDRRRRLTLLVVPPATEPANAHRALAAAAEPGNVASPEVLLSDQTELATQRWETEGGRLQRV